LVDCSSPNEPLLQISKGRRDDEDGNGVIRKLPLKVESPSDVDLKEKILASVNTTQKARLQSAVEISMRLFPLEKLPLLASSDEFLS
jgi:hypothetical protein